MEMYHSNLDKIKNFFGIALKCAIPIEVKPNSKYGGDEMKKRKSFLLYFDRRKEVEMLSDEQAGRVFKALLRYASTGEKIQEDEEQAVKIMFSVMASAVDENNEKYDAVCKRNAENGAKGGRPRKLNESSEVDENQENPVGFSETPKNQIKTEEDKPSTTPSPSVSQIVELFHEICKSYPRVKAISGKREKAIKARLNTYGLETIQTVFWKAEASSFLKGKNRRDWSANFDWIIADSNFCKILDGNYDDKPMNGGNTNGGTQNNPNYI